MLRKNKKDHVVQGVCTGRASIQPIQRGLKEALEALNVSKRVRAQAAKGAKAFPLRRRFSSCDRVPLQFGHLVRRLRVRQHRYCVRGRSTGQDAAQDTIDRQQSLFLGVTHTLH